MSPVRFASTATAAAAFFVLLRADSCGQPIIQDPTFHLWCGEELCAWKTDAGSVRKAPTWHDADVGVEFLGAPARISQLTPSDAKCMRFTSVADVDPSAQMAFTIDWDLDGKADYTYPVPSVSFRQVKADIVLPPHRGMRVVLEKKGGGRAVLAQIRLEQLTPQECANLKAEPRTNLPLGTLTDNRAECKSSKAAVAQCAECDPAVASSGCPDGARCGIRGTFSGLGFTGFGFCERGNTRTAGEPCGQDADCASGVCKGIRRVGLRGTASDRQTEEGKKSLTDYELCTPSTSDAKCEAKVYIAGTCE